MAEGRPRDGRSPTCTPPRSQLGIQESSLNTQKAQQEAAASAAANAKAAADQEQASEQSTLNQVKGQLRSS